MSKWSLAVRSIFTLFLFILVFSKTYAQREKHLLNTIECIEKIEKLYQKFSINECNYLNINATGFFIEKDTCSGFEVNFLVRELDPLAMKILTLPDGEGQSVAFYCYKNEACIRVTDEKGRSRYYSSFEAFYVQDLGIEAQKMIVEDFIKLHKLLNRSK